MSFGILSELKSDAGIDANSFKLRPEGAAHIDRTAQPAKAISEGCVYVELRSPGCEGDQPWWPRYVCSR